MFGGECFLLGPFYLFDFCLTFFEYYQILIFILYLTYICWDSKLYADCVWNTEVPLILYFNAIETEDKHDTV